ncbi:hypothetical protein BB559_001942 [Furculomyces boomerangus]|uniref:Uncharacterized protein n=2 Tax=Harpellales TaxID=61421 RepID=A0A2T9YZ65_9FUNG|nr:hypothetical protein BB559_002662 [Furculomyces boomerangus]PVU97645.1 hypothetical protein BB559_001942 [Furculomyces boomerangus]PWA02770.1 hypothetical protein BB558_001082 [Smittium angustum]
MVNPLKFFQRDNGDNKRKLLNSLPNRLVHLNIKVPPEKEETHMSNYCTNEVLSAQFTLINFIPKDLYRQFNRAANLYFLLMTIIQMQPLFAIGSPIIAAVPLVFVLAITALKDAFEDRRRHISDRLSNEKKTNIIKNWRNQNMILSKKNSGFTFLTKIKKALGIQNKTEFPNFWLEVYMNRLNTSEPIDISETKWKDVRVGDIVILGSGDPVPADMLVLSTSNDDNVCFADSKDLDGETNLKPRSALEETSTIKYPNEIENLKLVVECSPPNENMFVFNSKVSVYDDSGEVKHVAAGIKNTLMRGMIVRNTEWVVALVLYTGEQTKIIMNSGPPPFKKSRIERMMNRMVISNFFLLFSLSLAICIIGGLMYRNHDREHANLLYVDGSPSTLIYTLRLFVSAMVMLQNVIPISLYISIEFIKLFHAYFIHQDLRMYYEPKDIAAIPQNWNISDDMGQVGYVFSDKTGTLTNNVMDFRLCTINGIVYGKQLPGDELDVVKGVNAKKNIEETHKVVSKHLMGTTTVTEIPLMTTDQHQSEDLEALKKEIIQNYEDEMKKVFTPKYIRTSSSPDAKTNPISYGFVDPKIFQHMKPDSSHKSNEWTYPRWSNSKAQAETIDLFLTQMAVNHTVLVEAKKPVQNSTVQESKMNTAKSSKLVGTLFRKVKGTTLTSFNRKREQKTETTSENNSDSNQSTSDTSDTANDVENISYSAESADEGSLVIAARNLGYTFLGRSKNTISVDIKGQETKFEVLATLEFDSVRKRMSTVVKRPSPYNDIVMFTKGADTSMLDIWKPVDPNNIIDVEYRKAMFNQIDEFANCGLRTLVFGYRILPDNEYEDFIKKLNGATSYIGDDRQDKLDAVYDEFERNIDITGSTGIEDKLQDNVPDCIASLRSAGIRIWVLTGDKLETATNIGFASNLLTKDMELWTIGGKLSPEETFEQFWLMSKLIHNSQRVSQEPLETKKILKFDPREAMNLRKMSYQVGKATRYFLNFEKGSKEVDPTDAVAHSIKNLQLRHINSDNEAFGLSDNISQVYTNHHSYLVNEDHLEDNPDIPGPQDSENALVIDGKALLLILENEETSKELCSLAPFLKSVICARVSPLQKAQVVNLVKSGLQCVTLAIGDGANDVSMIQAADVGVAIIGEEGFQASNAADYSIARFHHLKNLLLVHGFFNYLRISESVLCFFYKNAIWALAPLWYTFYSRFSANFFYELIYIQLYNLLFTVTPVVVLGCIDRPFNYKTALIYTNVYKDGINNEYFSYKKFFMYMLDGLYQSFVCFFGFFTMTGYFNLFTTQTGKVWSSYDVSTAIACAIVICASLTVGMNTWSFSWIMFLSIGFSIFAFFIATIIISLIPGSNVYQVYISLFGTAIFWITLVLVILVALLPRYIYRYYTASLKPKDIDIIREIKILHRPWYGQVYVDRRIPVSSSSNLLAC